MRPPLKKCPTPWCKPDGLNPPPRVNSYRLNSTFWVVECDCCKVQAIGQDRRDTERLWNRRPDEGPSPDKAVQDFLRPKCASCKQKMVDGRCYTQGCKKRGSHERPHPQGL